MSNPVSILGGDLTSPQGRQVLQDALDTLYGLIQKAGGTAAGSTTFDELRVRMLTVLGTINVVPEDKPPANVNSRLVTPWLTGQRGRGEVWRFEDQNDGGDLLEVRSQPYLIGTPSATAGDWEFRFYSAQRDPAGAYRSLGAIRFGSGGRIRTYDATEVLLFDSSLVLTAATAPLPPRHVSGCTIRYASSSTFTVSAGKARDKADGADMTLAALVTVSTGSVGALGYERKTLTGTITLSSGGTSATGTGTAFLTEFGTRALTGTCTVAGAAVTGTGTKFLSEVAVGDLIGSASAGYQRVTSIESDTGLTIGPVTGLAGTAASFSVVEQPILETAGGQRVALSYITDNTTLGLWPNTWASSETGVACYATARIASIGTVSSWRAVWLVSGGAGTSVVLSTQRTTPYVAGAGTVTPSGYATSYRRIGWVRVRSDGTLMPQRCADTTGSRWVYYYDTAGSTYIRIVNNASSPAAPGTDVTANTIAPPTARRLLVFAQQYQPNTANPVYFGARGDQSLVLYVWTPSTTGFASLTTPCDCDGAQWINHQSASATGDGTYMDVAGYEDTLE